MQLHTLHTPCTRLRYIGMTDGNNLVDRDVFYVPIYHDMDTRIITLDAGQSDSGLQETVQPVKNYK